MGVLYPESLNVVCFETDSEEVRFHSACEMMPDAPLPRRCWTVRSSHGISSRSSLCPDDSFSLEPSQQGLPATLKNANSGILHIHSGTSLISLHATLNSPSFLHILKPSGIALNLLPANIHFSSLAHSATSCGNVSS